jgi:Plasmid pRiA4b ORF-3-like protein
MSFGAAGESHYLREPLRRIQREMLAGGLPPNPGKAKIVETRRVVVAEYHNAAEALLQAGLIRQMRSWPRRLLVGCRGWTDSHAHEFEVGDGLVAPDWWIQEAGSEQEASRYRDERCVSMAAVVSQIGLRGEFMYRYDMGDGWEHRIVIESPPASTPDNPRLPVCIAGENACPPEDVGGPHGYEMFLEILGDRDHEQYEDTVRWAGGVFDPKGFDLNRLNRDWKGARRSRA